MGIVTVTKLENADKDADSLNTFINGSDTAKVKTRTNKEYPTLANAVRQVMETGGFEPFATETVLLASRPTITKKAAKALDTKKVWLWDGTQWNDTGLSEKDLAIAYSNEIALSVNEQTSAEFHNSDETSLEIPLIVSNGNVLLAINGEGEVLNPAPRSISFEFHNSDESPSSEYIETDENGFIIRAKSKSDADLDTSKMQLNEKDLAGEVVYKSNNVLKVAKNYNDLYTISSSSGIYANPNTIYAYLDQLMSENTDYISKTKLGEDNFGYEINQYTLTCPRLHRDNSTDWTTNETKPPKIVITSGTHGAEKEAVISSILLITEIVDNWKQSNSLSELRYCTDLVIIPLICPSGYVDNTRENRDGININSDIYSENPAPETIITQQLTSLHNDAYFFIDHHNSYAFGLHQRPFWLSFINTDMLPTFKKLAYNSSLYLRKEFDVYNDQSITAKLGVPLTVTQADYWTKINGKRGLLLETPRGGGESIMSVLSRRKHNLNILISLLITVREFELNNLGYGA